MENGKLWIKQQFSIFNFQFSIVQQPGFLKHILQIFPNLVEALLDDPRAGADDALVAGRYARQESAGTLAQAAADLVADDGLADLVADREADLYAVAAHGREEQRQILRRRGLSLSVDVAELVVFFETVLCREHFNEQ